MGHKESDALEVLYVQYHLTSRVMLQQLGLT